MAPLPTQIAPRTDGRPFSGAHGQRTRRRTPRRGARRRSGRLRRLPRRAPSSVETPATGRSRARGEAAGDRESDPGAGEAPGPRSDHDRRRGRRGRRAPRQQRVDVREKPLRPRRCARRGSLRRPRARSWRGQLRCRTPGSARARSSSSVPSAASTVEPPLGGRDVLEHDRGTRRRERRKTGIGPLDEGDGVVEIRLEVAPLAALSPTNR